LEELGRRVGGIRRKEGGWKEGGGRRKELGKRN
jgi:hypothetical protein